jgi:DNA modification methylase
MNKEIIENEFKKNTRSARKDWSFAGERSIDRWTHGYHRYPAKFLPQLVKKIIETYASSSDVVGDVFAGCGTTLVESKAHGIESVGVDINPVAYLITKAKTNPVPPDLLKHEIHFINNEIKSYRTKYKYSWSLHERIDYWFRPAEKNKIAFLYHLIDQTEIEFLRNYFLCALSNILKNSSMWLQSGTKPQIDPGKTPVDPIKAFSRQILKMEKKNAEFYKLLRDNIWLDKSCKMILSDARHTTIDSASVSTIVTSPPYVTSYEYADIHQLTGYWFNYFSELATFRKNFIGTFHSNEKSDVTNGEFSNEITSQLSKKDKKLSYEVANYFNDMYSVVSEMKRILKPNGTACMVVGNTTMKEVRIKTAESFTETLIDHNFEIIDLIKRRINHKIMPTIRDKNSGKFTNLDGTNSRKIYPEEYIIIARKK